MTAKKKTWQEKLADKTSLPKFLTLEERFPCYNAVHKMGAEAGDEIVMVNPSEVIDYMRKVPYGKLTTVINICKSISNRYNVKGCCTLTAGIFIMTAANAVEEAKKENKKMNIPYWRTLKADGYLNDKFPGGAESHKELLLNEGFNVVNRGKRYFVEDYQKYLI
jgi:alkylated DNA nucleotide flippase Atl1